jgi:TPR repeat protein/uncharacterized RDD family membrane protein YckC
VTQWVEESTLILSLAGKSEWAAWELSRIVALSHVGKMIVVFPSSGGAGHRLRLVQLILAGTDWEPGLSYLREPSLIRSIIFEHGGRVTAVRSQPQNLDSYVLAVLLGRYLMRLSQEGDGPWEAVMVDNQHSAREGLVLASLAQRSVAAVLDTLLIVAVALVAMSLVPVSLMAVVVGSGGYTVAATLALGLAYYVLFEGLSGTTMGKLVCGVRVQRRTGEPCDFVSSLVRNLMRCGDYFGGCLLGLIVAALSPLRQRLGDRAAGTVVVKGISRKLARFFALAILVVPLPSGYYQAVQVVSWYRKASRPTGMVLIGDLYATGRDGWPKNDIEAVGWYRLAADAGESTAMFNLGVMYENGLGGLPKDDTQAVSWYRKAADGGNANGMARLASMYTNGRGGLPMDDAQAAGWYLKAANAGNIYCMAWLGFMYANGRSGLPKDDLLAVAWYHKAADAGESTAMFNLGVMYENGLGGLPKDDTQAVNWYHKAADAGDAAAEFNLGVMYENGLGGLPKDDAQAVSWYRKAADAGDGTAMANLGVMYANGRSGLPKDEVQAVSWYRKAADAGNGYGMAWLGFMYENGRGGLPKDDAQAVSWYRKAAQLGDTYARKALQRLGKDLGSKHS